MPADLAREAGLQEEARPTAAALAYVAPIGIFLAFGWFEEHLPRTWYPLVYCAKAGAVTGTLWVFRATLSEIRLTWRVVAPSVLTGLAMCVAWVAIDKIVPYPHLGERVAFNPFASITDSRAAAAFVVVRLYGLVLLVPVMEELFWRAFLLRYLTANDFTTVRIDAFSQGAFWWVAAGFGIAHPEWLPAVITACAYGLLLRRTGSLFATVLAHATTNAALGVYILWTHDWVYW
jgi:uncharacterized protein